MRNQIMTATKFQHTAARRRLVAKSWDKCTGEVSTHSRPKAAGPLVGAAQSRLPVSTHSRPKAAVHYRQVLSLVPFVSTHSRPKAAGESGQNLE